jgi:hypothetical protein
LTTTESLTELREVVIAFRGSDEFKDWGHNLKLMKSQFKSSNNYVDRVISHYGDRLETIKLVTSGFSLGGGLAMNAIRYSASIDEGWAFNTSPVDEEAFSVMDNQYTLSVKGEALSWIRWFPSGPASLGSKDENHYADYDLIRSNPISAHARWGLTRQLLILADMVYYEESSRTNSTSPPMNILKNSSLPRGCKEPQKEFLRSHGRM